jgi:hypothetical protein
MSKKNRQSKVIGRPVQKLDFGRTGTNIPNDFSIPSIGIVDIDRAVFKLFDEQLSFEVTYQGTASKVPVIFAAGERFALTRRGSPIRDKNNTLILPIISIMRNDMDFSPGQSGKGTAIAYRDQPDYYIKKKLAEADRNYQNIINKRGIQHQDNVSARKNFGLSEVSPGNTAKPGMQASRRNGKNLSYSRGMGRIGIDSNLGDNIFEIISIPYPNFVAINYNVIFWTQYMSQANEILETLLSDFSLKNEIAMTTETGYELVAFFDQTISNSSNFDDYSESERIIKHSINLIVPGYLLATNNENTGSPFRSFFSAPQINFGYYDALKPVVVRQDTDATDINDFILSNIESVDQIKGKLVRGQSSEEVEVYIEDPFTSEEYTAYGKVKLRNQRAGETVVGPAIVKNIDNQSE